MRFYPSVQRYVFTDINLGPPPLLLFHIISDLSFQTNICHKTGDHFSGSIRGIFPASGSPFDSHFSTSNNTTNSYLFLIVSLIWLFSPAFHFFTSDDNIPDQIVPALPVPDGSAFFLRVSHNLANLFFNIFLKCIILFQLFDMAVFNLNNIGKQLLVSHTQS